MTSLIWLVVAALVVLWLLGFGFHIGGGLIFLLLLLAVIGVIFNLLSGSMWGGTHHHYVTEVREVDREV